jgi:HAMP domain-containing protein
LVRFIHSKLNQISPDLQNDPLVKSVSSQLSGVEKIVATPFGKSLTAAEVTQLQSAINQLMQEIQRKDI